MCDGRIVVIEQDNQGGCMGMSTHIQGFNVPDEQWKEMKAVWDTCRQAGIEPPEDVSKYFEWDTPDERGVEVKPKDAECCSEFRDDYRDGYEIDVRELAADLTHIRPHNSY
jgi:hypothetical protein